MTLSILIPSLENRKEICKLLVDKLCFQIYDRIMVSFCFGDNNLFFKKFISDNFEIIVAIDNKQISTGKKRNKLIESSEGKYVVFIDDDDDVPNYYIEKMLNACLQGADCVAINGNMTTDGQKEIKWRISKDYDNVTIKENGVDLYLRKTNHITAVKREIALKCPFPDKSNAEDKTYSDAINKYLKTEFTINEPMYTYRYSTKNKEY